MPSSYCTAKTRPPDASIRFCSSGLSGLWSCDTSSTPRLPAASTVPKITRESPTLAQVSTFPIIAHTTAVVPLNFVSIAARTHGDYMNMTLEHETRCTIARNNKNTKILRQNKVIACVHFFIEGSYTAGKRRGNIVWKLRVRKQHFGQPIPAVHIVFMKDFAQHLREHVCTLHFELVTPINQNFPCTTLCTVKHGDQGRHGHPTPRITGNSFLRLLPL